MLIKHLGNADTNIILVQGYGLLRMVEDRPFPDDWFLGKAKMSVAMTNIHSPPAQSEYKWADLQGKKDMHVYPDFCL